MLTISIPQYKKDEGKSIVKFDSKKTTISLFYHIMKGVSKVLKELIRKKRKEKGLSMSELARKSGHPVSTIHGIETGSNKNPSFQTISDIAFVLNLSLDQLDQELRQQEDMLRKNNKC